MADVETPRVTPGLSPRSIRAFDAVVAKHTTALFEDLDRLAQEYGLNNTVIEMLLRERGGDLEDVYSEWVREGQET